MLCRILFVRLQRPFPDYGDRDRAGTEGTICRRAARSPGHREPGNGSAEQREESSSGNSGQQQERILSEEALREPASEEIAVYVCGAIQSPGVVYLPAGARVCDALEKAGGFTERADSQWLNQAKLLSDGEMLIVYTKEETAAMSEQGIAMGGTMPLQGLSAGDDSGSTVPGSPSPADAVVTLINLNTASKEQLMTLPGIGDAKADAIIRYRTETGLFASTEDVMNISGIKNSVYEKIRDRSHGISMENTDQEGYHAEESTCS